MSRLQRPSVSRVLIVDEDDLFQEATRRFLSRITEQGGPASPLRVRVLTQAQLDAPASILVGDVDVPDASRSEAASTSPVGHGAADSVATIVHTAVDGPASRAERAVERVRFLLDADTCEKDLLPLLEHIRIEVQRRLQAGEDSASVQRYSRRQVRRVWTKLVWEVLTQSVRKVLPLARLFELLGG